MPLYPAPPSSANPKPISNAEELDDLRVNLQEVYNHLLEVDGNSGKQYRKQLGDILKYIEDHARDELETPENPYFNYYCGTNHVALTKEMNKIKWGPGEKGKLVRRVIHRNGVTREIDPKYTVQAMMERMRFISPASFRYSEVKAKFTTIAHNTSHFLPESDFEEKWAKPLQAKIRSDSEYLNDPNNWYKTATILDNICEQTRKFGNEMTFEHFTYFFKPSRVLREMELISTPSDPWPVVLPPLPSLKPRSTAARFRKLYGKNPGPPLASLGHRHLRMYDFVDHGEAPGGGRLFEPGSNF